MPERNSLYYLFSVVRILLYPFALLYGAIVWMRNRLYDTGFFSSVAFTVPVISVGNLSVGGTGKTPHIEYLIRLLQYQYKVATMSRGYKRRTQGFLLAHETTNALKIGDEPMQYFMKFPETVVSVAEERMTGIPSLLQLKPEVDVVLLDDAYQHRSVKPGINILITDFSIPFYKDYILPYGSLRENRKAYQRADIIIISKCPPAITIEEADAIRQRIQLQPHQSVYFTSIEYDAPIDFFSKTPTSLEGKSIILVSGIAKPENLLRYLRKQTQHIHTLRYPDHHYYVSKDLLEIKAAYDNWNQPDKIIVTTEKDAARLQLHYDKLQEWHIPIIIQPISVRFLFNEEKSFENHILQYVEKALVAHNEIYHPLD